MVVRYHERYPTLHPSEHRALTGARCRAMKLRVEDGAPGNGEMRGFLHCAALRSG